jgi:hypothetical protein
VVNRRRFLRGCFGLLSLALLLLLTPARPLYAAPIQGDEIVLGDDLTLHEGEQINGDLVLLGGNLTMRAGSRVEGSVTAFGGRVEIDGTVTGEVVAFGGDIRLGTHAQVSDEVITLGGHVRRAEGAQADRVVDGAAFTRAKFWQSLRWPIFASGPDFRPWSGVQAALSTLVGALILTLLGVAIVHFWPTQTDQVGRTVINAPLPSLGVGCLLYPLAGSLILVVLITICLSPLAPLVGVLLVTASLFGWVALGTLWGRWLAHQVGWRRATSIGAASIGVFTLTLLVTAAGAVPLLGPLLGLGAASVGLGAVALSRFGTSPHRGRSPAQTPDQV